MLKTIVATDLAEDRKTAWLDLEQQARVELTSEDSAHPIESAFTGVPGSGWRAAHSGPQSIRLLFDRPQHIRRIRLVFVEERHERIQEFVLRWLADGATAYRDVLRQQFVFSPGGAMCQEEDYAVDLKQLTGLEIVINPDLGRAAAVATLQQFQLGVDRD